MISENKRVLTLRCRVCGERVSAKDSVGKCPECGGVLEVSVVRMVREGGQGAASAQVVTK
jgi:hypothetical protein